jgi:uncharacterized protein (DUF433 family)
MIAHIEIVQGVARTVNKHIKVKMIASKHLVAGETIDEIAGHYGITRADVHAALTYYYDNQEAFDEIARANEALLKEHGVKAEEHIAQIRARQQNSIED